MLSRFSARARRSLVLFATTASATFGIAAGAEAQTAGSATGDRGQQIEEVVVTASRRELTVRETPTAISAYGGQQLAREHVQTFADLTSRSPNIQFTMNVGNADIAIRGIGSNLQSGGDDPGVALHLDSVYVSDASLSLLTLLDVNRVEVLRGPQGTLFGRNATGGAVNIIANTPTPELTYGFSASAGTMGSRPGGHVDGFISGPLASDDSLNGRFAIERTYQQGDVKNLAATGPGRFNNRDDYALRGQLEWAPSPNFTARLLADYGKSDTAGPAYWLVGTPNPIGLPPVLAGSFIGTRHGHTIAATHGAADLEAKSVALFLDGKVAGGDLRFTVSRRNTETYRVFDGEGAAVDYTSTFVTLQRNTNYAELLYSSDDARRFSYILGTNFVDDTQKQNTKVPIAGFPAPVLITGDVLTTSYAAFAHAQYKITDVWRVFGGLRYSSDRKRAIETNNFIGLSRQAHRWSKPTFELGTSYDINPAVTGYVKYATGYKTGGYSIGSEAPPFAPETNRMWEAGLKGSYLDGDLQANLAVFHMSYRNLQVSQIIGFLAQVTNAAQATIDGAEVEFVARLSPDLRVQFDGGWLDAKFDSFSTEDGARPALGLLSLAGNRLPQSPKFTGGIGPVYSRAMANGGQLTLGARYDWKSRVYFSEFNLPLTSQPSSGRLSAYASYDLPDGHWQVGVYGRNLTDARTYGSMLTDSAVLNSITLGNILPRREIGAQVHYRY